MRVVVTGASGNVGTALLAALAADDRIASIVGVSRRRPSVVPAKAEWHALDVATGDLSGAMQGADAVVHLAWAIQPSHDLRRLRSINVTGSRRVFDAAASAGVPTIVHASSVGVYSRGPKDERVDETWPRTGIPTSFYARHKAEVEDQLDALEAGGAGIRIVRLRPGLIFSRRAASGIRRLFVGPLFPPALARPGNVVVVPDIPGLRFQAVHSDDVADAYRRALVGDARGAFNVAADPVLDPRELARILGARRVPVGAGVVRGVMAATWRARLQPTPPGWLDLGLGVPLMSSERAERELGWRPRHTSAEALTALLEGMADRAGAPTPPLWPGTGSPGHRIPSGPPGRQDGPTPTAEEP